MKTALTNGRTVLTLAAVLSALMSLLSIYSHPLLNIDAFSYLRAAEKFNESGLQQVLGEYGWYGYSILIALADRILPGDVLASAQILNTLSYMLLTVAFMQLCAEMHPGRYIHVLAGLAILSFPMVNEMRFMLIRDFAYWAFALLSLQQLALFRRTGSTLAAAGWCASLFAAIFFRLEGVLIVLTPCFLFWPANSRHHDFKAAARLLAMLAASLLLVLLLSFMMGIDLPALMRFAYRYYLMRFAELGTLLTSTSLELNTALFTTDNFPGTDNLNLGIGIAMFAYSWTLLLNVVNALGLPFTVLILWGLLSSGLQGAEHVQRPLRLYLLFATSALFLFVLIMHFLTQRYAALLCLLLLTQVPANLTRLARLAAESGRRKALEISTGVFICYLLIDGFISFGYTTDYIPTAASWTRDNLPATATLHTNSPAIAWSSGLIEDYDKISRDPAVAIDAAASGDYLVLDLHYDDVLSERAAMLDNLELLREFSNSRDDTIRIYRIP